MPRAGGAASSSRGEIERARRDSGESCSRAHEQNGDEREVVRCTCTRVTVAHTKRLTGLQRLTSRKKQFPYPEVAVRLSSDGATSHRATSLVTRTGLATRPVMFTATVATPAVAPLARAASASNARGANATATAPPRILRAAAALKSSSSAENRGASLATRGTRREMEELAGLGGDFGARDATAGELESNFNAKSIGEADTEHMLQIPRKVCSPHTGSHTTAMAW